MKDSIFISAFKDKKNVIELYKDLHSEENDVKEDDINIVTLNYLMINGPVNDAGFIVKNKILCLVEAQTTQLNTVLLRSLVYLAHSFENHLKAQGKTFYNAKETDIPDWEIYIVYSEKAGLNGGAQIWKFTNIPNCLLDLEQKEVISIPKGGIIEDYMEICKTIDRLIIEYGYEKYAVKGVFDFCKQRNGALSKFILSREVEIMGLYEELWTKEGNIEMNLKAAREEGMAEGMEKGRSLGYAEGEENAKIMMAKFLIHEGYPNDRIAKETNLPIETISKLSFDN